MTLKKTDGSDVAENELRAIDYIREHVSPEHARRVIHATLQGAVYCWCATRGEDEFAIRDLFGGVNADWYGTPLQEIYTYYLAWHFHEIEARDNEEVKVNGETHDKATEDVGAMLQEMLFYDKREFVITRNGRRDNRYAWQKQHA